MHSPDTYNTNFSTSTLLNRSSDGKCRCNWGMLVNQSNMFELMDLHIVATAIWDELEYLAELQGICTVVNLQTVRSWGQLVMAVTYNQQPSYADDETSYRGWRWLRIERSDLVLNLLERQGLLCNKHQLCGHKCRQHTVIFSTIAVAPCIGVPSQVNIDVSRCHTPVDDKRSRRSWLDGNERTYSGAKLARLPSKVW